MARAYLKYPELSRDLLTRADRYNRSLKKLARYEKEGRALVIRPAHSDGFGRMEKDRSKILSMYNDGYNQGHAIADKVKDFFAGL